MTGAVGLLCALLATAYALDPFDTGRSNLFEKRGVRPQGPRTADASRGRDPAFDSVIIGNSHIQLISPERLKEQTGLSFVQLSVPATGPKEQLVLIDWFMRHHRVPSALVLSADAPWCTADPEMPNAKPFPFWLYSRERLEYARGLVRSHILEELPRRVAYLMARNPQRARPDGYWDYEPSYSELGFDRDPELRARLERRPPKPYIENTAGFFPAAEKLRDAVRTLPAEVAVVLVFPPQYRELLPVPGSAGAAADRNCKSALIAALASHGRSAVVDWRVERPENMRPEWFFDQTHYRHPIARLVENDIAAALRRKLRD